ncbi:hypothetical protein CEV34_3158 [Brucella pseudogrignonensis]|uniref:Macro domain-containing protein n=1 Tax=Brucella pseudogrignonensis TaxID=419475 RepID=A0A256GAS7_9HYPH|nr:hypothetical protein CEV34_3158 [Brucella pseudogrignonensis]
MSAGHLLDHFSDSIVSPANSFGFRAGGIGLALFRTFRLACSGGTCSLKS